MGGGALVFRSRPAQAAALIGLLLLAAACSGGPARKIADRPPVTEQAARDLLTQAIDHTLAGDFESLCGLANRPMCEGDLKSGALASVPKQAPTVACSYAIPDVVSDRGRSLGGQVLVVDGVDGKNRRFVTEVLVFHDGDRLMAINAVWWTGRGIAQSSEPGRGSTAAAPATPEARLQKCAGTRP